MLVEGAGDGSPLPEPDGDWTRKPELAAGCPPTAAYPGTVHSLPPVLEVILRPDRRREDPRPVDVDMRRVILVGLALWGLGLAVVVVLWVAGTITATPVWSCAAGMALGLAGLVWERGHRPDR